MHGCWVPESVGIHTRVADGVAVAPVPGVRIHWTPERVGPGVDGVEDALACAVICSDLRALVVVIDSLANRRMIAPWRLRGILATTPRGRQALGLHDPRAESGIETLVRLGLRRHRLRARSQVTISGVGRVDLLIGERLVIEADGYEWHADRATFERDRERDRELVRRGYVVIRASYAQVMHDLDAIMLAVLDVIRRRDHRWRAVHRSQLSERGYLINL
jgi:very-short-patch-repair endonuclease